MLRTTGLNLSAFAADIPPVMAVASEPSRGVVRVELSTPAAFSGRVRFQDDAAELFARWRAALLECDRPIAVDVAIDLQGLGEAKEPPARLWQLSHRPIDYAFYADAPLTEKIGLFGTRFRAMLAAGAFELGTEIIEASPLAMMELLEFKGVYRGGRAHLGKKGWRADNAQRRPDKVFAAALKELGFNPAGPGAERLDAAEFNAIVCALTALGSKLGEGVVSSEVMAEEITARCNRRMNSQDSEETWQAPNGVSVLGGPFWESVDIRRKPSAAA